MDIIPNQIEGLIFDKDGTLFDFNATWGAWTRHVLEQECNGDVSRLARVADALDYDLVTGVFRPTSIVIASTGAEVAEVMLPLIEESSIDALLMRFNAAASAAPQVQAAPLVAFVEILRGAGLKIGVATNDAEGPARAHLRGAGVEDKFDFIAGFDSGFGGKPAPGQLHAFCNVVGLAPSACAMVGDSTHDLHAGRAAGMFAIGVLTGVASRADLTPHADIVFDSIAELPGWLGLSR